MGITFFGGAYEHVESWINRGWSGLVNRFLARGAATGHQYHSGIKSKPIDEACGVVAELEALLGGISATQKFFTQFREAFASA